jgi:hypothetical protein
LSTPSTTYDIGPFPGDSLMREDLEDTISIYSPTETPILTRMGTEPVSSTIHHWVEDSLDAPAENKQVEGHTFTYTRRAGPKQQYNVTQILEKTIQVTLTAEAVRKVGIDSLYAHELAIKMPSLVRDCEYAIINGQLATGASGTAREMDGILAFITTNDYTAASARYLSANQALIETALNDIFTAGAALGDLTMFCGGFQKIQIGAMTTPVQRTIDANLRTSVQSVDVYDGALGKIVIVPSRLMPAGKLLIMDMPRWKRGVLRTLKEMKTAITADAVNGVVNTEFTLIAKAEPLSAEIEDLATS